MHEYLCKEVLNMCLNNRSFIPRTDHFFVKDGYAFLGQYTRYKPKAGIIDVDGVLEKPGEVPLYKMMIYKLAEKNKEISRRFSELERIDKEIKRPEDVTLGEQKITKFYMTCGLRWDQFNSASEEVAYEFLKHSLVKGGRECISRFKEMNYEPGVISGSQKHPLEKIGYALGIDQRNVYGTDYIFGPDGRLFDVKLMLGSRKVEARDDFLNASVSTTHGCYFIFDDDPILDRPLLKAGLNPSFIPAEFSREELPDVAVCCPEAREDMRNLIPYIHKFEYGWVLSHVTDIETEKHVVELSKECSKNSEISMKHEFVRKSLEIIEIKSRHHLIADVSWVRNQMLKLLAEKNSVVEQVLMNKILKYLERNIPEFDAEESSLSLNF